MSRGKAREQVKQLVQESRRKMTAACTWLVEVGSGGRTWV